MEGAVPEPIKEARGKRLHGLPSSGRLHSAVARDLGIAIVSGKYAAGDILPGEHDASRQLRISRPAYREAIRMLAAKGLVESRPKAGTRVCQRERWNMLDPEMLGWMLENDPSPEFLDELFELRMVVEPAAAAFAAQRRTDAQLAIIADALEEMGTNPPDSPAGQAADELFHQTILDATGNELLIKLGSIIAASVGYVAEYKRERQIMRSARPDHEALFRAIVARRPSDARKVMLRHISRAREDTAWEG